LWSGLDLKLTGAIRMIMKNKTNPAKTTSEWLLIK